MMENELSYGTPYQSAIQHHLTECFIQVIGSSYFEKRMLSKFNWKKIATIYLSVFLKNLFNLYSKNLESRNKDKIEN